MRKPVTSKIRVRFAPSPTGFLHIGGLRTALYNYLFARKHGGEFVLRIEDTDQTRSVAGGIDNIIRTLEWCGIEYDEGEGLLKKGRYGPYVQSQRLEIYRQHIEKLVKKGKAYYCVCTPERLEKLRQEQMSRKERTQYDGHCRKSEIRNPKSENCVVRLKVPKRGSTKFTDIIRGELKFENTLIDDQVLLKSDGFPTYHLANVVDDHLMKITHVIRGEEWLPSTPKHVLLYTAFGWMPPQFAHLPLLLNPDKSKLSKRQGDIVVEDYIKKGYLREALLNFVALLGWNPRGDKELYTIDELIAQFDLAKVNKSGAVVNFEKLDWMNGCYIRAMSVEKLTRLCVPYFVDAGHSEDFLISDFQFLMKIVALEQDRLKKLSDIVSATEFFFGDQPHYHAEMLQWKKMKKEDVVKNLAALYQFFIETYGGRASDAPKARPHDIQWNARTLEAKIKAWIKQNHMKVGEVLWPFRVALSGRLASPPPFEIAEILGQAKTVKRIEYALQLAKKL